VQIGMIGLGRMGGNTRQEYSFAVKAAEEEPR